MYVSTLYGVHITKTKEFWRAQVRNDAYYILSNYCYDLTLGRPHYLGFLTDMNHEDI